MDTNTGQEGSSRAVSEAASVPAPSSTGKPSKKSKRSRSITPEGGLVQQQYTRRQLTDLSHDQSEDNPTKAEPPEAQWQGFPQHSHNEQKVDVGGHNGHWMQGPYGEQQAKLEPEHERMQATPQLWHESSRHPDDEHAHHGDDIGGLSHQLSRGLSSSQSVAVSNTDSGKSKKTGLKIKLKLKPN